jgi:hypothetical protein
MIPSSAGSPARARGSQQRASLLSLLLNFRSATSWCSVPRGAWSSASRSVFSTPTERRSFAHSLYREVLYDQLNPEERRDAHVRVARHLGATARSAEER